MFDVQYADGSDLTSSELAEFYQRVRFDAEHSTETPPMLDTGSAFVTARVDGRLVGLARGLTDGLRGYLTECKLDPAFQGPAAVTRTDGRIEHDTHGIAGEMARRVLQKLYAQGVKRVDVVAWGTEEDFLAELGFRRSRGMVGMTMRETDWSRSESALVS